MASKKRVLVVDDQPGIANVLRIKLRLAGYDVITTTSGVEAVELVRAQEPDIMLLDSLIPDMTGADVFDRVRTFSVVPIIICSARADGVRFARTCGADDFIAKPYDPDHLIDKIRSVLKTNRRIKGYGAVKEKNPPC